MTLDPVTARKIAAVRRSLAQIELGWGVTSTKLLPPLMNLADLYFALGQYVQAELLYSRYLIICCKKWGETDLRVALGLRMMGQIFEVQGLIEQAEHQYLWALNICSKENRSQRQAIDMLAKLLNLYRSCGEELKAKVIERKLRLMLAQPVLAAV